MTVKDSTIVNVGSIFLLLIILLSGCKGAKTTDLTDYTTSPHFTTIQDTVVVRMPIPQPSGEVLMVDVPVPIERVVQVEPIQTVRKNKVVDRSKTKVIVRNNDIGAIITATDSATVVAPITKTTNNKQQTRQPLAARIFGGIIDNIIIFVVVAILLVMVVRQLMKRI